MNGHQRVAVVTGGAQGIGAAIGDALAADGWDVAIVDLDADRAAARPRRSQASHGVRTTRSPSTSPTAARSARRSPPWSRDLGPVTGLVNNAGIDVIKPFVDSTEDEWDRIIAVNLKGTIACCRAVLDGMIERQRGRIVSIASDAGRVGSSGEAVYSATKGGVISFTKTLAREVARTTSAPTACAPAPPRRRCSARSPSTPRSSTPGSLGPSRWAAPRNPTDIAPAVAFLRRRRGRLHHGPDAVGQRRPHNGVGPRR